MLQLEAVATYHSRVEWMDDFQVPGQKYQTDVHRSLRYAPPLKNVTIQAAPLCYYTIK